MTDAEKIADLRKFLGEMIDKLEDIKKGLNKEPREFWIFKSETSGLIATEHRSYIEALVVDHVTSDIDYEVIKVREVL